jgi:hypothetical protein
MTNEDIKIKQMISKEVLDQVPETTRYIIKSLVFDSDRNWNTVLRKILIFMPELWLKLNNYGLDEKNFK